MAKIKEFFSRIQITYRRSINGVKIMVIVAIVLCMGALITLRLSMNDLKNRTEDLRQTAAELEEANVDLREDIDQLGSMQSIVEIAEDELDLVQPGTVIFNPES